MMKYRVKKCEGFNDSLLIYDSGSLVEMITIDRTFYGPEWNEKHGMIITETIEADDGMQYDIWRRSNELVCAIPVRRAK